MKKLIEHPYEFQINKAFRRFDITPKKVAYFKLRHDHGSLHSFGKIKNVVFKVLIIAQHGKKTPTIIKLESPLQGEDQLKLILFPEKQEIAIYVKSCNQEYGDFFRPKYCKNSRLWALFELQGGVYGILFDSQKPRIDFGFQIIDDYAPNPFDLMSMGIKPTFMFEKKEGDVKWH